MFYMYFFAAFLFGQNTQHLSFFRVRMVLSWFNLRICLMMTNNNLTVCYELALCCNDGRADRTTLDNCLCLCQCCVQSTRIRTAGGGKERLSASSSFYFLSEVFDDVAGVFALRDQIFRKHHGQLRLSA